MKIIVLLLVIVISNAICAQEVKVKANEPMYALSSHKWDHGASSCALNDDPEIEIYQFSKTTYLLRQNKCTHYEAPFIYVLFGDHTVFVQDTGATSDPKRFPLYDTIKGLVKRRAKQQNRHYSDYKWLITHSHSHSDHIAGDGQFRGKPNITLIEPNLTAVQQAFGFKKALWPNEYSSLELGERTLTIMPLPGHKSDAIAVYDEETQWLLTGDSLYPGRLYVKDWMLYRASIMRLREFAENKPISALMGTHIEMSNTPEKDYEVGSTYQPNEAALPMSAQELRLLNDIMQRNVKPEKVVTERFIVYPVD